MIILSVVIPTYKREKELLNTLKDLTFQSLPKENWECLIIMQSEINLDEIILIINNSNINARIFYSNEPNQCLAMNIGLLEAKGEIVLFLDDDLIIENHDFLLNHIKNYFDKKVCGVVGQVTDLSKKIRNERHKWSYKRRVGWLYFPSNYNKRTFVLNGGSGNLSVKKKLALEIGGFDINFEKGAHRQESDFCLRLTKKYGAMVFDPTATVIHIGAKMGGCRSWGMNIGIHPIHHIIGEWYFILNGIKNRTIYLRDLHHHLAALIFRQILNKNNIRNPILIIFAALKSLYGLILTFKKIIKKPKTLHNFKNYTYKLIFSN